MNTHSLTIMEGTTTFVKPTAQSKSSFISRAYIICFSLYMLQGQVVALGLTMPYLYRQLPTYRVLALFTSTHLPFSFKFFLCPFLEKYTSLTYGKRKTWIIISQIMCSLVVFVSSHFTQIDSASLLALGLMAAQFFITIQDVSLDSLSIKQLKSPQIASHVQTIASSFGTVMGSLLLLKLTSNQFANKIGMSTAITSVDSIMRWLSLCLLVAALLVHFGFKQTSLQCQKRGKSKPFLQIIGSAKVFLQGRSKYCRLVLFMLVYYQGLKFFQAGYDYQLVKNGFSRDTSNSISNLIALPILFLTFKMIALVNGLGIQRALILTLLLQCFIYAFNITVFSLSPYVVATTQFCATALITLKNMILFIMSNSFPTHALTGMYLSITYSVWNLGELNTLNTLIIDSFGWRVCTYIGIAIQLMIIIKLPALLSWVGAGVVDIDPSILEDQQQYFKELPNNGGNFAQNSTLLVEDTASQIGGDLSVQNSQASVLLPRSPWFGTQVPTL